MANELSLTVSLLFNKSGASVSRSDSISVTVTGDVFSHEVLEIGTSEETIVQTTEMGTPGYMFIKNLDTTNYVQVGCEATKYVVKLKALDVALFRVDGAAILAKATGGACLVEYILIEE